MKFIRTFDGKWLNLERVEMLYVNKEYNVCALFDNKEVIVMKFTDECNAQKWLDDMLDLFTAEVFRHGGD